MALLGVLVLAAHHCVAVPPAVQWRVRESAPDCANAEDCSLNGKCEGGRCICSGAWKGDSCEVLRLKDGSPSALGYHGVEKSPEGDITSLSSWGGSAHRGKNGTYHLISSEIGHGVGMTLWNCASRIIHATSPDPLTQPFVKQRVLFESFAHEPRCAFNPAGGLVCFFVHNPAFHLNDKCGGANGTTPPASGCMCAHVAHAGGMPTMMSYIADIDDDSAEWSSPQAISVLGDSCDSNISPYIFPNGSLHALYRDNAGTNIHVITATDWSKPASYQLHTDILRHGMELPEDPFLYRGPDGSWHSLHHAYPWPDGTHAFSLDGWNWQTFWSCKGTGAVFWKCQNRTNAAFTGQIAFAGAQINAGCRERPSFVFGSDGTTPVALLNGMSPDPFGVDKQQGNVASGSCRYPGHDYAWTSLQPLERYI
jgi:hypothetical protein